MDVNTNIDVDIIFMNKLFLLPKSGVYKILVILLNTATQLHVCHCIQQPKYMWFKNTNKQKNLYFGSKKTIFEAKFTAEPEYIRFSKWGKQWVYNWKLWLANPPPTF